MSQPDAPPHASATGYAVIDGSDPSHVRLSEVLAGLSYALDLTEGQRPGHAVRSCLIGMRLAEQIGLPRDERSALFYALLMKDLGCSSNAARFAALFGASDQDLKADIKYIDWSKAVESFGFVLRNAAPGQGLLRRAWRLMGILSQGSDGAREVVRTRCERGADIARLIGLDNASVQAIRALDEHWDGHGQPYSLRGHDIPLLGRILGLAQTVEVFFTRYGVLTAYDMAVARRGTWFDPALVDALLSIGTDVEFWRMLGSSDDHLDRLRPFEPEDRTFAADEPRLDAIAQAFAQVIDAKSPWTFRHSNGVADVAVAIGRTIGHPPELLRIIRRAGLLHDVGKLAVSNLILDKPGKLTEPEFAEMRRHTQHTARVLGRVSCFRGLAAGAAAHHERLDGRGYHLGLQASQIGAVSRMLSVADIYDALRASRPYRVGLPLERVFEILDAEAGNGLDPDCVAALRAVVLESASVGDLPPAEAVATLSEDYEQAA